jgi:hypothetical protein
MCTVENPVVLAVSCRVKNSVVSCYLTRSSLAEGFTELVIFGRAGSRDKRAEAEDFLSHALTFPRLGIIVALTLHEEIDMRGRLRVLPASARWCPSMARTVLITLARSGTSGLSLGGRWAHNAAALRSPSGRMRPCATGQRCVSPGNVKRSLRCTPCQGG